MFDDGDAESKALALCLFGCWAGFAAESANIRYLVLSSLVSPHVSEVWMVFGHCSVLAFMFSLLLLLQVMCSLFELSYWKCNQVLPISSVKTQWEQNDVDSW